MGALLRAAVRRSNRSIHERTSIACRPAVFVCVCVCRGCAAGRRCWLLSLSAALAAPRAAL
jgi:hypothetical protein